MYEAQYEEAVRHYRSAQSKEPTSPVKSAISSTHADDTVDGEEEGATDGGMLTAEGVEGIEGSRFHYKEKKNHGARLARSGKGERTVIRRRTRILALHYPWCRRQ